MGRVGLPAPIAELAGRRWDVIVVGGGHNGLTAAAYLARAGRSVLVLERRDQLGGACTLEQPFPDPGYVLSPCAYAVGLLDRRVIEELGLPRRGYHVYPVDPHLWCGFGDGTSYAEFIDPARTADHLAGNGFTPTDIAGLDRYYDLYARARRRLREGPDGDTWVGSSPSRERIEEILDDQELTDLVFEDSVAEVLERYVSDSRLHRALWGQGVIGTWAGPRTAGTAMVKLMHSMGSLDGEPSAWGYVRGGMGTISFAIADSAREAGATLAAGVPVARIRPGEGVELESGELLEAEAVVCNADPKRLRSMLAADADAVPDGFARRLEEWKVGSPVVKLNLALDRSPSWSAAEGDADPQRAMSTVAVGLDQGQAAFEASIRGVVSIGFCEIYCQSSYDPSIAPEGKQTMSVFAQYAPYELADGDWDSRRDQIADAILDAIAGSAPDVHDCVAHRDLLGPPEIESRIGLSGGHIFQGEALPEQMWDCRLDHRTPVEALYLCGAATHPGGSVIGLNGRNAAMALLEDLGAGG
jgi:phytoene dehydrogenase-like protein